MKSMRQLADRATVRWRGKLALPLLLLAVLIGPATAEDRSVELLRDQWGVPHSFASTDEGAAYGLGYAAAEDRGFQMYYFLRIIQGRLSELVGDLQGKKGSHIALESDRKMRTFGYAQAAQRVASKLDPETARFLQAYSDGVNAYFKAHKSDMAPEFEKFGVEPETWTPAACILSWWHIASFFSGDGTGDWSGYQYSGLAEDGKKRESSVANRIDEDAAVVQRSDVSDEWVAQLETFAREHGITDPATSRDADGPKFSHAWVVGGKNTTTGSSVLVSDPQTTVTNPSLMYEFHAKGKTFNVRGIGVAGSPMILIGFTDKVAWGGTALAADQADLFQLKIDPANPNRYQYDGQWRDMETRTETINVKDGEPVTLQVRSTVFGPIVSEFVEDAGDAEFAVKCVPLSISDSDTSQALLDMWRAKDANSFFNALEEWQYPSANCVFGDADGNIGYTILGAMPVRSPEAIDAGKYPHPGTSAKYDWQGMIPHDLKPHVINPKSGRLLSANHRQIQSFYPLYTGSGKGSLGESLRSWRLRERLSAKDTFTPEDVLDIHFDNVNPARRDFARVGYNLRATQPGVLSPESVQALEYLEDWYKAGARLDLRVPGTALANEMPLQFRANRTSLVETYGAGDTGLAIFCKELGRRLDANERAEITSEEAEFVDSVLQNAWKSAVKKYGDNPQEWTERARRKVIEDVMPRFGSLDQIPSLDPENDLHWPALVSIDGPTIFCQVGQSYTQFVPLDDADDAMTINPIGSSERVGNPFRTSTLDLWAKGELHPAPLSREGVKAIEASGTVLER